MLFEHMQSVYNRLLSWDLLSIDFNRSERIASPSDGMCFELG